MNSETFTLPGGVPLEMIEIPGTGLAFGKYPVTQEQWEAVMGGNPSHFRGTDLPVESVSWHDCQEFCAKISTHTGREFRLPTAVEWETALAGQSLSLETGWFSENSGDQTHPPGQLVPNAFGLYDMHGNVWEWCNDGKREGRFLRGGSWLGDHHSARSVYRDFDHPSVRKISIGFRVVRVLRVLRPPSILATEQRVASPSLAAIVEQLASCDYRCEAGPLVNNSSFLELRAGAQDEGCLAKVAPCGDCAWCRMFGEK